MTTDPDEAVGAALDRGLPVAEDRGSGARWEVAGEQLKADGAGSQHQTELHREPRSHENGGKLRAVRYTRPEM
jgi:hypothetical protein